MSTTMIYNSKAVKEVKPDIVGIGISFSEKADTAKEAIDKLTESRFLAKKFITSKKSFQKDSYHQFNFGIHKRVYRESYLVNTTDNSEISDQEYNSIPQTVRQSYSRKIREKFLYYEATIDVIAVLEYGDTTVKDLIDILNMCTEKHFDCRYKHEVSSKLKEAIMQELYAECINKGVAEVQKIINGLDFIVSKKVYLIEIYDPDAVATNNYDSRMIMKSKNCMMEESSICSSYEPEQIITPELIEELFNNNIELTKSLDLKLSF